METFDDLVFEPHSSMIGVSAKTFFDNGYGVSVIMGEWSYGGKDGLYELAVLKGTSEDYDLCYDTEITSDVLGYLSKADVTTAMLEVQKL